MVPTPTLLGTLALTATSLIVACASPPRAPEVPGPNLAPAPDTAYGAVPETRASAYIFAWPFLDSLRAAGMQPRGGTTRGAPVTLIPDPSDAWLRLRAPGLDAFRRDRAAILAMAGDYRASFDFLETAVFTPPPKPGDEARPARPYRSWGTERIYVVADSPSFLSLQHVMVMFFEDAQGALQGPMVMKHWRQDWRYEPPAVTEYRGREAWARRALSAEERKGAWSQAVYHVDDSPRYASVGRWEHNPSFSAWTGNPTRRPLPRREHTARSDYHAIEGRNRHTILPRGWLHEQDNLKLVLDSAGAPDTTGPFLARELGVDRYDLIQGFDFSAGDAYWQGTGLFWAEVRARWERTLAGAERIRVNQACGGEPAFAAFFGQADRAAGASPPPPEDLRRGLDSLFACILAAPAFPSK